MKALLPPVRAVVFDMGGVLTTDPFAGMIAYADELGIPSSVIADAVRTSPEFKAVETGTSTIRDFLKWLCVGIEREFGVRVDIRQLAACLASGQEIRAEMPALIEDLHAVGMRLAILTNNAREARAWWESGVLPLDYFEAVFDSSDLAMRKPDPAIFDHVAFALELKHEEVIFVDDLQENVDGALTTGMRGLIFRDPIQCRWELMGMLARSSPAHVAD